MASKPPLYTPLRSFSQVKKKRWKEEGEKKKLTGEQATRAGVANAHERYESFSTPMYVRKCVYARLKIRSHWKGPFDMCRAETDLFLFLPIGSHDRRRVLLIDRSRRDINSRQPLDGGRKRERERKVSRDERNFKPLNSRAIHRIPNRHNRNES